MRPKASQLDSLIWPRLVSLFGQVGDNPTLNVMGQGRPLGKAVGRVAGIDVVLVDGSWVRGHKDPEFHAAAGFGDQSFVPANEVWVNSSMAPEEWAYVALHEVVESILISRGWKEASAHAAANEAELSHRRK